MIDPKRSKSPRGALTGESPHTDMLHLAFALTHDLRTPLASIIASLQQIESLAKKNEPLDRPLARVMASADRLARSIDEVMIYAQAGHERPVLGAVDIASVIRSVTEDLGPLALGSGVVLVSNAGTRHVLAEGAMLRRCLENVIGNAIKFTSTSQGVRRVMIDLTRRGDRVIVQVRDTGPGIPPDKLDAVFMPFARASRAGSGTGLGLAIVRQYMTSQGGSVHLESDGRSGTLVVLEFQAAKANERAA
jgi:signal transduction histidine kinase